MRSLGLRAMLGALLIFALALVAPHYLAPTHAQGQVVTVDIANFAFNPSEITVSVGTTVEWVNRDPVVHTSTSDTGLWDSGPLSGRGVGRFRFTFDTPGSYTYHCEPHPWMTARIVVQGPAATPTPAPQPSPTATPQPSPTPSAQPVAPPSKVTPRLFLPAVFREARR